MKQRQEVERTSLELPTGRVRLVLTVLLSKLTDVMKTTVKNSHGQTPNGAPVDSEQHYKEWPNAAGASLVRLFPELSCLPAAVRCAWRYSDKG